ncbi:DUF4160 domain-containing protein [Nitrosovibrio sp. Nv17]|uniref:DUF4160 domain-containing protein n=1 Tax=Nitrosovibrio sp. Nv17 TaxID=1855339 RepID=UPI000930CB0F|nr:DUF4160 domain-containing protein [Nitrosovibrio sp. Nv17]
MLNEYVGYRISIDIQTLQILKGRSPRRSLMLLLEWAQEHRAELIENWRLCQLGQLPNRILPLP